MGLFDPKLEFIVDATTVEQKPDVTIETIEAALAKVRRVIICAPGLVDQLVTAVNDEGLTGSVRVTSSDLLGPREAFIVKPGALADQLRETGSGYTQRWIAGYDRGMTAFPCDGCSSTALCLVDERCHRG
jgi:hypothetical protein